MRIQPMITVADVEASSDWYQRVLGLTSAHGGREYERLDHEGTAVLQLHDLDPEEHPELQSGGAARGAGVALWFETPEFDVAVARARDAGATFALDVFVNPNANHREIWLRDLDGYLVVVSSPWGDLG